MVIKDDEEVLVAQECLDRKEEESQLASEVESKSAIEVVTMQKEVQQAVGVITARGWMLVRIIEFLLRVIATLYLYLDFLRMTLYPLLLSLMMS